MKRVIDAAVLVVGREDRAACFQFDEGAVVVVADGAGGIGGGAAAAQSVVDEVARLGWQAERAAWFDALARLDRQITPGEAAAVVVAIREDRLVVASVGDCEAWWFSADREVELTAGQKRKPLLGSGAARIFEFTLPLSESGTLLVGSDGLWKYTRIDRVRAWLSGTASQVCRSLVESVRYPGGDLPDDVSVVVCRIELTSPGARTSA